MKKNLLLICFLIFAQLTFGQVVVDGVIDAGEWDLAPAMIVEKDIDIVNIMDANDYSAYFKMLWTDSALYLLLDIKDDSIYLGNSAVYMDDNIEIYFDVNNSKIQKWPRDKGWSSRPWSQMDDNDMQLRIQPTVDDVLIESNASGSYETILNGIVLAQVCTDSSYVFEMSFALDSLAIDAPGFSAVTGTLIGFELDASDNDGDPDYRDQVGWTATNDLVYTDAALWGTLEFQADGTVLQILDEEAPSAPGNLMGEQHVDAVALTWDASMDSSVVDWYVVLVDGLGIDTLMAKESGNAYTVEGLSDANYTFGVCAIDPFGNISDTSELNMDVVLSFAITIDGVIGAGEWDLAEAMPVEVDIDIVNIADADDYSVYYKMLWSDTALYLLLYYKDDSIYLENASAYTEDNTEIYFDMNNSKIQKWPRDKGWSSTRPWTQFDDNDIQLRIQPTVDSIVEMATNASAASQAAIINGTVIAQTHSETGYIFEFMFNLDSLAVDAAGFVAAEGTEIGFDLDASDNDGDPDYRDQVGWNSDNDLIYTDACLWGTLLFGQYGTVSQVLDEENPTDPANLLAEVAGSSVTLTWDPSTDNIIVDKYIIYDGTTEIATINAKEADNSHTINDLDVGHYTFGVRAQDPSYNVSGKTTVTADVVEVSINNKDARSFRVYPVPASDVLVIDNAAGVTQVELFNLVGQSVLNVIANNNNIKLDVSNLKAGVYIMQLHTADRVFTEHIIIE
jgi:hypothetical protein